MSPLHALLLVALLCVLVLAIMFAARVLTYRKGRGGMLATGLLLLVLSVAEFQSGRRAAATHTIVPGGIKRGPMTAEQEYAVSGLLVLVGTACIVLSLQRTRRDHNTRNV